MRLKSIFIFILFISAGLAKATVLPQKFDKAAFYAVMKSGDLDGVASQLEAIKEAPEKERDGYEGALLMKKAGLLRKPKDRLSFFKQGRIKLETALIADNENTEFHFLRLAIEEHAPKIVKYHSDMEKDKAVVVKNFKNQSPTVKQAIMDYCENSKVLRREEF